ncbi:MAG: SEC-C domain-containing protein [Saprospiraceae bacterium]|nr:SEC-C domain-containing protein [Bacteroidota bacterium]MBK7302918.1 SEC-C domain-containing protein [Candidatus Vicinibacter affinis]MBK7694779.1 SEC-C domain-containing protein [Candidatus Vicinibacter affinis]MBK8642359.1 SEC-C domain-containing protein [Candidatus Vicinibacter affinis]
MIEDRFYKDFIKAKGHFPSIEYEILKSDQFKYRLHGNLQITDEEGTLWGIFQAAIYFKSNYPLGFASLQELSNNIPREVSRHINKEGFCCVCNPLEALRMELRPNSIIDFIENYTIPFFANQIYCDKFGSFKNGEYSHGNDGIWESFEEEFNTKNRIEIQSKLDYIQKKPGRNELCYCGSNRKIKNCHWESAERIRKLLKRLA